MRTMKTPYELACSTKEKRETLASRVEELATKFNWTVHRSQFDSPHELGLTLRKGDYAISLSFDGRSKVGYFMGHWFMSSGSQGTYPVTFAADIKGSMNTIHYRKATSCERQFEAFLSSLQMGFESLQIELDEAA